jgi:hypothetical protein
MAFLAVFLLYLTSAFASEDCPTCIRVNSTCYNVSHIVDLEANFRNKVVIRKLGVLHSDNILFFSYEPEISDAEYYKVAFVNLDDPATQDVIADENEINHSFGTFDIDQEKSTVYLGGKDGIFTYGTSKKVYWFSSLGDEILVLFFKTNLFIVKANDSRIIVKKGDAFNSVLEYTPIRNLRFIFK